MKRNKLLLIGVFALMVFIAACSPAQQASGSYNITSFSTSGLPTSSGTSGTVTVTENGSNAVNIKVSTSGNPDFNVTGCGVSLISIPGIQQITFSLSGNVDVTGTYADAAGVTKTLSLVMTNNVDTTSMDVVAFKQ